MITLIRWTPASIDALLPCPPGAFRHAKKTTRRLVRCDYGSMHLLSLGNRTKRRPTLFGFRIQFLCFADADVRHVLERDGWLIATMQSSARDREHFDFFAGRQAKNRRSI